MYPLELTLAVGSLRRSALLFWAARINTEKTFSLNGCLFWSAIRALGPTEVCSHLIFLQMFCPPRRRLLLVLVAGGNGKEL
jgi:hypothetical protein